MRLLGSIRASVCLLLLAGGCEPESPGVKTGPVPENLLLDTVTVVHSDLFFRVRGVRRLPERGLAVMNEGSVNVLLLDSMGGSVATIGRLGEGPGEFLSVTDLDTKGDSVLVLDALARRVQFFDRASLVHMWSLRGLSGSPRQISFSPDGPPVVAVERRPYAGRVRTNQVIREAITLHRVDDPGTVLETPIDILGGEYFVVTVADGAWRTGIPAFGASATYDLTRTRVIVADARHATVVSFPWGGFAARTLRPASPPTAVSEAEMDRLWDYAEATARRLPERDYLTYVREAVDVWGKSVPRPFYTAVISDGSETLIQHYSSRVSDVTEWSLLAEDGETLGKFSLDRDTRLFSLQDREVLGVGLDSLDVEHVIVGRIRDPS